MSVEAKLNRLSLDLHSVSQKAPSPSSTSKSKMKPTTLKTQPVADSWEDESNSDTDLDRKASANSGSSTPLEAPGPDIKSPATRAIDAEKELAGELLDDMPTPPPTPISPELSSLKADWSTANILGGGRPTYTSISNYAQSNPSSSARSTPIGPGSLTPTHRYPTPNPPVDSTSRDQDRDVERDRKRPEKTTATANRLIAGALGIKAPPKTDEQRRYERAVKEQEIKRRNREKEEKKKAEEEDERAKAAVWDS